MSTRRGFSALALIAVVAHAAGALAASGPDSYLCYKAVAAKQQPKFPKNLTISLVDRTGGPQTFGITKTTALCTPVDRDGAGVANPAVHLEAFPIKTLKGTPKFMRVDRVRTDGFAERVLTVTGTATLLDVTPALLGSVAPAAFGTDPTIDPAVNRFKCYKAKLAKGAPKFVAPALPTLTDELFPAGQAFVVKKVVKLCEPVDKDGETPGAETRPTSLVCYAVKLPKGSGRFVKRAVATNDVDVSPHLLVANAPAELCMPATAPTATPTVTPTPTASPSPGAARRVFVTSTTTKGGFGGVAGADAICTARATAAALGGTFKAWVSVTGDGTSTRFTQSTGPYALIGGTVIANDWSDLVDGTLAHAINVDENGVVISPAEVWTATSGAGAPTALNCNDFSNATGGVLGVCGSTATTGSAWTNSNTPTCNVPLRLYCFEQ